MRALRVVGLGEDGQTVVLEDAERGERFTLPADDRLRAAARGDLPKLGQAQIELESQLRPREIQARIRGGESIEQLAASAGVDPKRIERYAYPVLLERSRTADLAQRAHPVREDGPDVQTLGEVVAHAFSLRGQDYDSGNWDSWRGEDGKWVVQLLWRAGRSDIRAHWIFHPGAHGGTVTPLDEHAADLIDPTPNRSLRTVRPVTQLARQALELDESHGPLEQSLLPPAPTAEADPVAQEANAHGRYQPEPLPAELDPGPAAETGEPETAVAGEADEQQPDVDRRAEPAARKGGRKNHPIVPSWEDVLLGVRSQRG
ncbi:septation protein SepH [Allokutzneria sp. A3M-2-11 16]|uniref:septation protein SepH n=1 Tax=Allokutzneria sp. A3M-2-11 16 TaxID=2962043 RepID=UPI0020B81F1E|nr:septation protein SepH [Allokutzneria sp. A3M-2-11 16]MCP3800137.1 septation protein SepH [Allokutzneria sp. A3M-2-11 16]